MICSTYVSIMKFLFLRGIGITIIIFFLLWNFDGPSVPKIFLTLTRLVFKLVFFQNLPVRFVALNFQSNFFCLCWLLSVATDCFCSLHWNPSGSKKPKVLKARRTSIYKLKVFQRSTSFIFTPRFQSITFYCIKFSWFSKSKSLFRIFDLESW